MYKLIKLSNYMLMNPKHTPSMEFSPLLTGIVIGFIGGCLATLLFTIVL
jgi:H+/Cl- antiporter ClcA